MPDDPSQQHDGQTPKQRLQGRFPNSTLGARLHPKALDALFVTLHEFQCHLVEFLAQPGWRHCDHASVGCIQVRNPQCVERNPCLAVQVQPERPLLVECSRFFLREEPDPERQRRVRWPGDRSRVGDQGKRWAHRKAVADMRKPRLAGLLRRREQDFDERAFRDH